MKKIFKKISLTIFVISFIYFGVVETPEVMYDLIMGVILITSGYLSFEDKLTNI